MIVPVMAISNLVLTQQIYYEETNGAHAHYREPVPLRKSKSEGKLLKISDGKIKHFYTILAKKLENMGCHFGRCICTYFSLLIKLISLQAVVGPSTRSRNI